MSLILSCWEGNASLEIEGLFDWFDWPGSRFDGSTPTGVDDELGFALLSDDGLVDEPP